MQVQIFESIINKEKDIFFYKINNNLKLRGLIFNFKTLYNQISNKNQYSS